MHSANKFDVLSQDVPVEVALPKRFRKETIKVVESKQRSKKKKSVLQNLSPNTT